MTDGQPRHAVSHGLTHRHANYSGRSLPHSTLIESLRRPPLRVAVTRSWDRPDGRLHESLHTEDLRAGLRGRAARSRRPTCTQSQCKRASLEHRGGESEKQGATWTPKSTPSYRHVRGSIVSVAGTALSSRALARRGSLPCYRTLTQQFTASTCACTDHSCI